MLGGTALILMGLAPSLAEQLKGPTASPGSVITTNGSWLNVGQSAIGLSRSNTHQMRAGGIPAILELLPPFGDIDGDGDADLDDHALFALCMSGPDVTLPPRGCSQEQFDQADLHSDSDVDMEDFRELAAAFSISN